MKDYIELVKTCEACPEQYDAFRNGEQVGYLRLRWGLFRVRCPNSGGDIVLEMEPNGDGVFDPDERDVYLGLAIEAIQGWIEDHA